MVSAWFSMSRRYTHLETAHGIELWEIPCMYKGWHVVISRKQQGELTQIQAGASRNLEDAMLKAFYESFLKPVIPIQLYDDRLPKFQEGSIKHGDYAEPILNLREWKASDLYVVKQFSYDVGDMRRGVPQTKVIEYSKFLGDQACKPIPIQFNWCH
jgi:hypothetical protein